MKFGGLWRLTLQTVGDLCALRASASAVSFYVAYHLWLSCCRSQSLFHFAIAPLTVDCGIFRSEEISRLDLLHRRHPITEPRWNSLSSWERPILSQMLGETVCMPRCLLLYTRGHGSDWNTWFALLGWVSEYFWQLSVCRVLRHSAKMWQ